jgi:hypothetical protein
MDSACFQQRLFPYVRLSSIFEMSTQSVMELAKSYCGNFDRRCTKTTGIYIGATKLLESIPGHHDSIINFEKNQRTSLVEERVACREIRLKTSRAHLANSVTLDLVLNKLRGCTLGIIMMIFVYDSVAQEIIASLFRHHLTWSHTLCP